MEVETFSGYLVWVSGESPGEIFPIEQAIFRDGSELAIDCNCPRPEEPNYVYTIVLKRQDSLLFEGYWRVGQGDEQFEGACSCRVYPCGDRVALIGSWTEDGKKQRWFGELYPPA